MTPLDPAALAKLQLQRDRKATARFPGMFEHKLDRMSSSPLAFLRGAAPLFYTVLKARPELARGPKGTGWLTGDMHLENFGAYRPDPHSFKPDEPEDATFDLNDFDDAAFGPFVLDVLRLATSLILGGRELGADGVRSIDLCERLLASYSAALAGSRGKAIEPTAIRSLVEQAADRSRAELLAGRTHGHGTDRRFVLGDRYAKLPATLAKAVPDAFEAYVRSIRPEEKDVAPDHFEVLDAARRIAGTGSLGCVRIAVLTRGKGGDDGQWVFDLKEQGAPSASILLGSGATGGHDPVTRVITAAQACLAHPPRMLGKTRIGKTPLFGRRLAPQEDKLDLTRIDHADLEPLASDLGAILGRAHRRGAEKKPTKGWSESEREAIVDHAILLAGIHEAVYLALCKETRG